MTDFVTFSSLATEPYERGRAGQRRQAGPVAATVASYRRLWEWLDPNFDLTSWGRLAWGSITRQAPRAADEIAGIADGSGLGSRTSRPQRPHRGAGRDRPPPDITECSTVVSSAPDGAAARRADLGLVRRACAPTGSSGRSRTADGRVGSRTVDRVRRCSPRSASTTAALGVMLNMLHHSADDAATRRATDRPPGARAVRAILLDDSRRGPGARPRPAPSISASTSLTVVDHGGNAASFELSRAGGVVKPEAGSSSAPTTSSPPRVRPAARAASSTTTGGYAATTCSPPSATTAASAADVHAALTHHDDAGPICRHAAEPDDLLATATLATATLDVEHGELAVLRGGPCGHP